MIALLFLVLFTRQKASSGEHGELRHHGDQTHHTRRSHFRNMMCSCFFFALLFRATTHVFKRVIVQFSLYSQTLFANASWSQISKLNDSRRHLFNFLLINQHTYD
jgi:hypothetical protein